MHAKHYRLGCIVVSVIYAFDIFYIREYMLVVIVC